MVWRGNSLRLRLSVAGLMLLLVACIISFFGLSLLFERHVERRLTQELEVDLGQIIAKLERNPSGRLVLAGQPVDSRFAAPLSGLYWQIESGDEVLRSRSLWDGELEIPALEPGSSVVRYVDGPGERPVFMVARELAGGVRLGDRPVLVAVAIDRAEIDRAKTEFRSDLAPFLTVLGIILLVANFMQIQLGLMPLASVKQRIAEIRSGRARRMDGAYPMEILPLTEEVDGLLASREAQLIKARKQAADLAHGLKTPLQALAGDVERLKAEGKPELAREVGLSITAMRRHVDHQLARARLAERGQAKPVAILTVVERVIAVLERTPRGQMLDWTIDVAADLQVRIEADDLAELMGNLMENAVRYASDGVAITAGRDGNHVWFRITDDGPGIPADKIETITRRGERLDQSSGGAGLGLSIVEEIVNTHGGTLAFENANPGLSVTVRLPST